MMLKRRFPVQERVKAGVSYKEMLQEVGAIGALMIVSLIVFQLGAVFTWPLWFKYYSDLACYLFFLVYIQKALENLCFLFCY
jgi:hypothetical protein